MLLEKTLDEFKSETDNLVKDAVLNGEFVKIKTDNGNLVLITEEEWDMLCQALAITLKQNA